MSEPTPPRSSAGRHHSTVVSPRRVDLNPLPLLIRVKDAAATPNPAQLVEGACVLGAGGDADLVITSDTVSRRHAEVRLVPEGVIITDLGSKNGLYYLG